MQLGIYTVEDVRHADYKHGCGNLVNDTQCFKEMRRGRIHKIVNVVYTFKCIIVSFTSNNCEPALLHVRNTGR
jgi:hypothetical protein